MQINENREEVIPEPVSDTEIAIKAQQKEFQKTKLKLLGGIANV